MNKICVYTCITGGYDDIQEIKNKEEGIDYYCFTNNPNIKSDTWKVIRIEDETLENITLARKTKILGNDIVNKYDIALWMDGSTSFKKPIKDFIKKYFTEKDIFTAFKHGERDNIKDECFECVRMRKEKKSKVKRLLKFYEQENYNFDNGLIESTVYIKRPKDKKVIETMEMWFSMLKEYSNRDQLTFNYCLSKTNMPVHWINLKVFDNEWLEHKIHNPKKVITDCRIYFDDSNTTEETYDIDSDFIYPYKVKGSNYSISTKVQKDTKIIEIELSDVYCVAYSEFKISLKCKDIYFFNTINYHGDKIFYNSQGIVRLEGNFRKGDKLDLSINFYYLSEVEKMKFINDLSNKSIILSEDMAQLEEKFNVVKDDYEDLIRLKHSKFYKMYLKLAKIKGALRGKK